MGWQTRGLFGKIAASMDRRAFTIMFLLILFAAIGVFAYTQIVSDKETAKSPEITEPDASAIDPLFQQKQQQQQNPNAQTQQQPNTQNKMTKQYSSVPAVLTEAELKGKKAVIVTAKGNIEFQIYTDSPKAASNFIFLAKDGFYDGVTFHRVVPGFVIQGGDPTGTGSGGPGYRFEDEKVTRKYEKGTVAMANAGPNTNGSQFFIVTVDNPPLENLYTIFGKVTKGQEVVDKIQVGDVMQKVTIENI